MMRLSVTRNWRSSAKRICPYAYNTGLGAAKILLLGRFFEDVAALAERALEKANGQTIRTLISCSGMPLCDWGEMKDVESIRERLANVFCLQLEQVPEHVLGRILMVAAA